MSTYISTLTDTQLERLYVRVWRRMTAGDGYQPFGYDRPTLAATRPGWLAILDAIKVEARARKFVV